MRRAAKVDASQKPAVRRLRQAGALVWLINKELDALVLFGGRLHLVDFKTGADGELTDRQRKMIAAGWPVEIWRDEDEALAALGIVVQARNAKLARP